jgi:predicted metal-dependent phosphoesterase TrpH
MKVDLHTHTSMSDGKLTPSALLDRAADKGIELLSITDHDTTAAYTTLPQLSSPLKLVPGIEFSTYWHKTGIHIVGLNVDLHSDVLQEAIAFQSNARQKRAEHIAANLEKQGIKDALQGAREIAGDNNNIGRPHFAAYLVKIGAAKSMNHAFDKYLDAKSGDIKIYWADLPRIIEWVHAAGGIAVLAHPLHYKLTRTRLVELLDDFIAAGGKGLEVISGKQAADDISALGKMCVQKQLLASCGSDFHQPDQGWAELGQYPPLPKDCKPVWECF